MAKQTFINIPTPCSQNWEEMDVVPGGRFCDSCEKKVIDFSLMNDRQILEIFNKRKGEVCGRFVDEQLNRSLVVSSQQSNALIPAVLISTALMVGTAVHASAEKRLPAIEQDTVKPVLDSIVLAENLRPPLVGYTALNGGLVVTGYTLANKRTYTTGAVCVVSAREILFQKKRKRWWVFWR
jgi:hypothetical protein